MTETHTAAPPKGWTWDDSDEPGRPAELHLESSDPAPRGEARDAFAESASLVLDYCVEELCVDLAFEIHRAARTVRACL